MDLRITGKCALIGASGQGLGLACAQRLANEGCHVAMCDFKEAALNRGFESVVSANPNAVVKKYLADLTQGEQITLMVNAVASEIGPVDILVTNSGGPPPGTFDSATDEKWCHAYELTFLSATRLIRLVLPGMKERKWGRIINLTSRTLREPIANLMISNAVRLAVAGMAKTLAGEVAGEGVTVNNVGPGPTSTDRAIELATARAKKKGISLEAEIAATNARIPRGQMAAPEEIADAVGFLASDLAGHITGQSLIVDGGETRAL
jgi:3-oxoacyl-[acyl-carrier protein] reductase